jgi:mycobactin salicyl-AMP ligase
MVSKPVLAHATVVGQRDWESIFGGSPLSLPELNGHHDERGVAAHSRPDVLAPMSTLPTTAVGKVDKKAIVKVLART